MAFESEVTPALTLGDLVEVEKCVAWSQPLCVPCPECGVEATVESGLAMCCAMFEPELILAVQNSTAAGGCKWYHMNSYVTRADSQGGRGAYGGSRFDVACRFGCSFFKAKYQKQEEDSDSEVHIVRRDARHLETAKCKALLIWHGTTVRQLFPTFFTDIS